MARAALPSLGPVTVTSDSGLEPTTSSVADPAPVCSAPVPASRSRYMYGLGLLVRSSR